MSRRKTSITDNLTNDKLTEMERVLCSMDNQTIIKARSIGGVEFAKHNVSSFYLLDDILKEAKRSKELSGLVHRGFDLYLGERCVAVFTPAGNDLLVAIAAPHAVPAMDVSMKKFRTLHLLPEEEGDSKLTAAEGVAPPAPLPQAYEVYCVANGVEKLKKREYALITKFVVAALTSHQRQSAPLASPHDALKPVYFKHSPLNVVHVNDREYDRFFAMSGDDWNVLSSRYVDCRYGRGRLDTRSTIFDLRLPHTWADPNAIVLIGGESGSGKTMEMLCGHCDKSNLVVYIRFSPEVLIKAYPQEVDAIRDNDAILCNSPNDLSAREARNAEFLDLAAKVVQSVVEASCHAIVEPLKNHNKPGDTFTVRLCFDEMGSSPAFVRACCAMSTETLREKLLWGDRVEIFVVAAGTGIGTVSNPGGSENKHYQLAMLTRRETPNEAGVYWMMREHLLKGQKKSGGVAFEELQRDVTALQMNWNDRIKRNDKLQQRSTTLSALFKAHTANIKANTRQYQGKRDSSKVRNHGLSPAANENNPSLSSTSSQNPTSAPSAQEALFAPTDECNPNPAAAVLPTTLGDPSFPLAQEALFAAVESDGACAAALSNPRMGALFVSVVREVAEQTISHQLSVVTSGTNIRRTVLQRVAIIFRSLNGLAGITPQEASALLIESLRYSLFDGYDSSGFSATELVSGRGVLVDNAVYEIRVPEDYEMLHRGDRPITKTITDKDTNKETTYYACYPKDVGRFTITPAMVVVLTTLMTNAFEENFSNIGDVFERDMAKFLFFTVQAFHGRPVRELVDFVVGPSAVIGKAAQEILEGDTKVDFDSLTLRIAGSLQANCHVRVDDKHRKDPPELTGDDESLEVDNVETDASKSTAEAGQDVVSSVSLDAELWSTKSGGAWVEMSTPGLASADVVLHIPNVITLPIQCKDRVRSFPYREVAKAMNSMLVESKRWRDPDPTKERPHPEKTYAEMTDDLDKVFAGEEVLLDRAATAPNPNIAAVKATAARNGNSKDYGQALCDLDAPVIRILYVSRALTLSSTTMSWDHLNAIGPHCIMAEGIGEHSLEMPQLLRRTLPPDAQYLKELITARLHRVRRSIMQFEFRQSAPMKVVDLAVTAPPPTPNVDGQCQSDQCAVLSEALRNHHISYEGENRVQPHPEGN